MSDAIPPRRRTRPRWESARALASEAEALNPGVRAPATLKDARFDPDTNWAPRRRRRRRDGAPGEAPTYGSSDESVSCATVTGFGTSPRVVMKSSDCCQPAVSMAP